MKLLISKQFAYTCQEIQDDHDRLFEKAYSHWTSYYSGWAEDIMASLQAILKQAGAKLSRWEIGGYRQPTFKMDYPYPQEDDGDMYEIDYEFYHHMDKARTLTWIENNILAPNRIPWKGEKRWDLAQYGRYYHPDMVKPCPWTGYCADDDLIEHLIKRVRDHNDTLGEALDSLVFKAHKLMEEEYSPEAFLDYCEANEIMFDALGNEIFLGSNDVLLIQNLD